MKLYHGRDKIEYDLVAKLTTNAAHNKQIIRKNQTGKTGKKTRKKQQTHN